MRVPRIGIVLLLLGLPLLAERHSTPPQPKSERPKRAAKRRERMQRRDRQIDGMLKPIRDRQGADKRS